MRALETTGGLPLGFRARARRSPRAIFSGLTGFLEYLELMLQCACMCVGTGFYRATIPRCSNFNGGSWLGDAAAGIFWISVDLMPVC